MAVYSGNRTRLGAYSDTEVVANENYGHQTGLLQMMVENVQNDQAIFEAVIYNDFREAAGVVEESTILNEAGNFIDKIKQFLMNCWEKITGFFKSFFTKINSVIMRDNKEFVKKYQREVVAKDLSKMKYKWNELKDIDPGTSVDSITSLAENQLKAVKEMGSTDALESKINNGELIDEYLSLVVKGTSKANFYKDIHEALFGEKEEKEGVSNQLLREIMAVLTEGSNVLKEIKKLQSDTDKSFKEILRTIDKFKDEQTKLAMDKDDAVSSKGVSMAKRANLAYKIVQIQQDALNMIIKSQTDAVKYHISQCRRVYAQCASFNPKSVRESAILVEAAGDAAEYDVMSSFEDYSL